MFTYNGWHYNWLAKKGFASLATQQHTPQSIINVSVGNVGSADYSQQAHLHSGHNTGGANAIPVGPKAAAIAENAANLLPRS